MFQKEATSKKDEEESNEKSGDDSKTFSSSTKSNLVCFDRLKPMRKRTFDHDESDDKSRQQRSKKTKKEYGKLRNLVPALNERSDLSKVEIIEETIRYIDALHHQLATRMTEASSSPTSTSSTASSPLQTLPSTSASAAFRPLASSSSTSAAMSSPGEIKAAVENIQAMFALYLEEQTRDT